MTPTQLAASWANVMSEWNRMPQSTVRTPTNTAIKDFTKRLAQVFCIDAQPDFGTRVISLDRSGSMSDFLPTHKKHHPEQGDDEIFMGNTVPNECHIGWKTRRFGQVAYNIHGERIKSGMYVPAFIKKQEVREALADERLDADRRRIWEKMLVEGR